MIDRVLEEGWLLLTRLNYRECFYFILGTVVGCGGHEAVSRLLGW